LIRIMLPYVSRCMHGQANTFSTMPMKKMSMTAAVVWWLRLAEMAGLRMP
jgi:hypothetical protein